MLAGQPVLAIARGTDGFPKVTHVSMVGHILHGEAAGAAAAAVGHAFDLDEVRLAEVQQSSIVCNLLHVPALHQGQPANEQRQALTPCTRQGLLLTGPAVCISHK